MCQKSLHLHAPTHLHKRDNIIIISIKKKKKKNQLFLILGDPICHLCIFYQE